jgi:hypothetical protein
MKSTVKKDVVPVVCRTTEEVPASTLEYTFERGGYVMLAGWLLKISMSLIEGVLR